MLLTIKNKTMMEIDKVVNAARKNGEIPDTIKLNEQEAIDFIKEMHSNRLLTLKLIEITTSKSLVDIRLLILDHDLTREFLSDIINKWRQTEFEITYDGILVKVVNEVEAVPTDIPIPDEPLNRVVKEGEIRSCLICSSSLHSKWIFWTDGCLNTQCENYYAK